VPALMGRRVAAGLCACALAVGADAVAGCKPKASPAECSALVDHYAALVVTEHFPDAGADRIAAEQEREKGEARSDDSFKNCSSEVSRTELDCAMRATTANAVEKCLE
jgi:hypothetical protein